MSKIVNTDNTYCYAVIAGSFVGIRLLLCCFVSMYHGWSTRAGQHYGFREETVTSLTSLIYRKIFSFAAKLLRITGIVLPIQAAFRMSWNMESSKFVCRLVHYMSTFACQMYHNNKQANAETKSFASEQTRASRTKIGLPSQLGTGS